MRLLSAVVFSAAVFAMCCSAQDASTDPPKAGPVQIMNSSELKPGMRGTVWTVFEGSKPEPVPVEIVGLWKNAWGPRQDVILAKMGGKAARTNVAGGMSGSPVYVDGKLIGAVSLRLSIFSPDAICGITPIELMMEINGFDKSKPADARTPDKALPQRASLEMPSGLARQVMAAGAGVHLPQSPILTPIETPLSFSGFHGGVLEQFQPLLQQMGVTAVAGGASGDLSGPEPAPGWQHALNPGDAIAGVLVSGDMSITGLGTVTYNNGKEILAFGHSFFNLGPVEMPMSKGEVLMVLSSQYQPNKFANATEVVGSLVQDRHSGIMGELGQTAEMIPVTVKVRSFEDSKTVRREKDYHFNVFVNERWTPTLMMMTMMNTIQGVNDFADDTTYRLRAEVELHGQQNISLDTMLASNSLPVSAPVQLAGWWGDKFNRLFLNTVQLPRLKSVNATVDLLPDRRELSIESALISQDEVEPGGEVKGVVFLRPFRGDRIARDFKLKIPAGMPKGTHRILFSDADVLNRMAKAIGMMNRFIDLPQTVSLLNQERRTDYLYISLVESRPTLYYDDKTLPSLPDSILNVMRTNRTADGRMLSSPETAMEQMSIPMDSVVSGSYSVRITVK